MKTVIKLIVAYNLNNVIGLNNKLPWHIPEDLKHFRLNTLGKNIVMGKNTFYSLNQPLKNRNNIVLSTSLKNIEGITVFNNIDDLLNNGYDELIIIGGDSIYKQFIDIADELIITKIGNYNEGDTYFPYFDESNYSLDLNNSKFELLSSSGDYFDILYYKKRR